MLEVEGGDMRQSLCQSIALMKAAVVCGEHACAHRLGRGSAECGGERDVKGRRPGGWGARDGLCSADGSVQLNMRKQLAGTRADFQLLLKAPWRKRR